MTGGKTDNLTRAERIFVRISVVQTVIAVIGFFVGAVALYAALNEADAVRKQQQAAVWPHIRVTDVNFGTPGEERFDIVVSNKGIGPARIEMVNVTIGGVEQTSWYEIVRALPDGETAGISSYRLADATLSPEEDIVAVSVEAKYGSLELVNAFRDLVRGGEAAMEICYCSVFDDCWMIKAAERRPSPIKRCPAQKSDSLF